MQQAKVTHRKLLPANPELTPSMPPVSERDAATMPPAHTRTALARLGIKIACDLAASPSTAPCARALPSSLFYSHDEKCARIAME
jgi:hypothetical protein